jgi:hypothetical protein
MFGLFRRKRQTREGTTDLAAKTEPGPAFFVPGVDDRTTADRRLGEARQRLEGPLKGAISQAAFAAIDYEHDQFGYRAEVGALDPRANETVRAILRQEERGRFLILTDRHGFLNGLPLIVGDREVRRAVSFRDA